MNFLVLAILCFKILTFEMENYMPRAALLLLYVDSLPCCTWEFFQFPWFWRGLISMFTFLQMLWIIKQLLYYHTGSYFSRKMQWLKLMTEGRCNTDFCNLNKWNGGELFLKNELVSHNSASKAPQTEIPQEDRYACYQSIIKVESSTDWVNTGVRQSLSLPEPN